jgi:general secretion pathway protein J
MRRLRGMTLIEVTVALALLSLLSVGILAAFRFGQRAYAQITRTNAAVAESAAAQRFLRTRLESAYPFQSSTAMAFRGSLDSLSFTAPAPQSSGTAGFERFEIATRVRNDGSKDLIVRRYLDRNGAAGRASMEPLMERVQLVEWSYRGRDTSSSWTPSWHERDLPALVRLHLSFPRGDARAWTDLIVAPRITEDANCEFDVIALTCREDSP